MEKRTRTILFLICLFLFFLIAPLIILYSQGYRIDLDSRKIVKTGGFYFKVWPGGVQVFIDGKFKKKTNFLSNNIYLDNLLPKEYKVEIKKQGFYTWQKNIEIKENLVTEFNNILLIPENPKYENLAQNIESFFFSPDGKKIILKEKGATGWNLKIIELDKNLRSNLFSGFQSANIELLDLKFSQDSKRILLSTKEKEKLEYWLLELGSPIQEKMPADLISLDFLGDKANDISFNPSDSQEIFFTKELLEENNLFEADFIKKEVGSKPIIKNLVTYEISEGNLFWISKNGFVLKTNFTGEIEERLNFEAFPIKEEKKYQIYIRLPFILLKEDEALYILNPESRLSEKLSESSRGEKFSPDWNKILYFNNYEIWFLFLEKNEDQPERGLLERLFLTRFSEKIEQAFWLDSNYVVFDIGDKVKISEIDNRDKINFCDFSEFKSPEIFFNQFDKKLYILSERNIFSSEKLIP
jgi:hypothetical protein